MVKTCSGKETRKIDSVTLAPAVRTLDRLSYEIS